MNINPIIDQMQYQDKIDADDKQIREDLAYHKQNWLDAVLKSPRESLMHTVYATEWDSEGKYTRVPATSEDILLDEILEGNEMKLAEILIRLYKEGCDTSLATYIDDLADSYAERMVGV